MEIKIGERISELLNEKNISDQEFAQAVGVNRTTVNRWKRSAKLMRLSQIVKIADYFNCSLDFLTGRSEQVIDFQPKELPAFYENFRCILEKRGISRNQINKETRIKSSHFVDWKKGADPHIFSLIELAEYLEITLDCLVGRDN